MTIHSKLGLHVNTGPRDGIGQVLAKSPVVVLAVNEGGVLVEAKSHDPNIITIYRDTSVYGDVPHGIDQMTIDQARRAADDNYPKLITKWRQNPADYYIIINETGGDNIKSLQNVAAFEMRMIDLVEADNDNNFKLCLCNHAGGSPSTMQLWQDYVCPVIDHANGKGHIYGRHAYGGVSTDYGLLTRVDNGSPIPANDNAWRPFLEAHYMIENGVDVQMVITEAGQYAGYLFNGDEELVTDMGRYDQICRTYANIIGFCTWTYGDYLNANIQAASGALANYLSNPYPDLPGTVPPPVIPPPPTDGEWETVIDERFEGYNDPTGSDWYDQNGVQQVRVGTSLYWRNGSNQEAPTSPDYGLMEAIFRWDAFVPEHERGYLLNKFGHAYKMFASHQPWKARSTYNQPQPEGRYRLTLSYYDDNYVDDSKTPPPDPLSFEARIGIGDSMSEWIPSAFQQQNIIMMEFDAAEGSEPWFGFRGRWAIKNLSAWVHRFKVEKWVGEVPPDPPTSDCQDQARIPYGREYWVIPPTATAEQAAQVFANAYPMRITVGFSYDDAGVGSGLASKRVVLFGISDAEKQEYLDWYSENYSGVDDIEFRELPGGDEFKFTHWPTEYESYSYDQGYFGSRPEYYGQWGLPGHEGVDLKAPMLSKIFAVADGVVTDLRTTVTGHNYGRYIRVQHVGGYETTYAHLDTINVVVGQPVTGGQQIALADSTGNSSGSHLHLTLKHEDAYEGGVKYIGYPHNIVDPTPFLSPWLSPPDPPTPIPSNVLVGLHASADSGVISEAEMNEHAKLKPTVIKFLSSHAPQSITELCNRCRDADVVIRAFLDFGGRDVSAQDFYNWTINDVIRSVRAVPSGRKIWIELHNEPNLVAEGFGSSWVSGAEFADWVKAVLSLYRQSIAEDVKYISPALSPVTFSGDFGQSHDEFLAGYSACFNLFDSIGVHSYWSQSSRFSAAVAHVYGYNRYNKPLAVTESSRVDRPRVVPEAQISREYYEFWEQMKTLGNVQILTFFVASASNDYFDPECWIDQQGNSRGYGIDLAKR